MCTLVVPMERSFMRSSVALRLIFAAIAESVMFSSMRMTFLWAPISCAVFTVGRRGIICPGRPRMFIGRPPI